VRGRPVHERAAVAVDRLQRRVREVAVRLDRMSAVNERPGGFNDG
jgi:hypothetical protein